MGFIIELIKKMSGLLKLKEIQACLALFAFLYLMLTLTLTLVAVVFKLGIAAGLLELTGKLLSWNIAALVLALGGGQEMIRLFRAGAGPGGGLPPGSAGGGPPAG